MATSEKLEWKWFHNTFWSSWVWALYWRLWLKKQQQNSFPDIDVWIGEITDAYLDVVNDFDVDVSLDTV